METKAQVSGAVLALGAFETHLSRCGHSLPQGPAFVPVVCHSPIMLNQNSEGQKTKMSCVGDQWYAYLLQKLRSRSVCADCGEIPDQGVLKCLITQAAYSPVEPNQQAEQQALTSLQSNQRAEVKGKLHRTGT